MTAPATTPTVEDLPLAELRPWDRNPRRISKERHEALKRSLVAEPEMLRARPLIVRMDGTVIAGNKRLAAALDLGWPSLPGIRVDLDDARATEWALRDNRPYGEDDEPLVGELLAELAAAGRGLDLTGYESGEVDRLLAAVRPAPTVDPDEAPPLPAEPRSVRGEVYELGPHRLMCGDATSEADVAALVGTCRPEVLWTDPPYGVGYEGSGRASAEGTERDAIHNDDLTGSELEDLLRASFSNCFAKCDGGGAWYVAAPPGPTAFHFEVVLRELGVWRQTIAWVKDVFVIGRSDYHGRHETLYYGWKPGAAHRWTGDRKQDTVWELPRPKRSAEHPTMKPVALIERALVNSSGYGDHVLDPFAGSGTTLIACEQLERRALCMEIDPAYCDVIRQRYADFTGQPELAP